MSTVQPTSPELSSSTHSNGAAPLANSGPAAQQGDHDEDPPLTPVTPTGLPPTATGLMETPTTRIRTALSGATLDSPTSSDQHHMRSELAGSAGLALWLGRDDFGPNSFQAPMLAGPSNIDFLAPGSVRHQPPRAGRRAHVDATVLRQQQLRDVRAVPAFDGAESSHPGTIRSGDSLSESPSRRRRGSDDDNGAQEHNRLPIHAPQRLNFDAAAELARGPFGTAEAWDAESDESLAEFMQEMRQRRATPQAIRGNDQGNAMPMGGASRRRHGAIGGERRQAELTIRDYPHLAQREITPPSEIGEGRYTRDPPKWFCCPISGELMERAVLVESGQTFELFNLNKWLNQKQTNPMTNAPLRPHQVFNNLALQDAIDAWKIEYGQPFSPAADAAAPAEQAASSDAATPSPQASQAAAAAAGAGAPSSPAVLPEPDINPEGLDL